MTYRPAHRRPQWHDRPRAWLRAARGWLSGREEEEVWDGTDDHGNHIGDDLPPVRRWPMPADDRPVIQAALVQGETIILDGEPSPPYNPAWMPCWSRPYMPRPGQDALGDRTPRITGPGYLSAFASPFGAPGHIPPTPRPPREPVTWWRPRECGGRITLLAGAW